MVNLVFGANAPLLTRVITDEINKEITARDGFRQRIGMEITDLSEEERLRFEAEQSAIAEKARIKVTIFTSFIILKIVQN